MAQPDTNRAIKLELSPEELEFIRKERGRMFFTLQLPATLGSTYGAYYLQKSGIWSKSGGRFGYFPKCFGVGIAAYTVTTFISAYSTMMKLKQMGGSFADALNGKRPMQRNNDFEYEPNPPSDDSTDMNPDVTENTLNQVLNSKEEILPSRSLTYDDLRRRNRLHSDVKSPISTPNTREPPTFKPPPASFSPGQEDKGKTNKYGDSWSN